MNEAQRYDYRAEELKTLADDIKDQQARESLLEVAAQYTAMAEKRRKAS